MTISSPEHWGYLLHGFLQATGVYREFCVETSGLVKLRASG